MKKALVIVLMMALVLWTVEAMALEQVDGNFTYQVGMDGTASLEELMQADTENSDMESGEIADDLEEQTIEGQVSGTISWRLSEGTLYIEGTGEMPNYEYPTSEKAPWTPYREEILSIIVSEGITELGNYNFPGCENLKKVQLPQTLRYIGGGVFASDSSLEVIAIPDSVTSTSWDVFYGCKSLRSVVLSSNLTKISSNVFYGTSPDLVIYGEAGSYAQAYANDNGISFSMESCPDFPDYTGEKNTALIDGSGSYDEQHAKNENLGDWQSIPSYDWELRILEDGTKEVVEFLNKEATEAVLPEGVTHIGHGAFYDCKSLTTITLPESLTSMGDAAFCGCSSLTGIMIPDGVTSIGTMTFCYCESLFDVMIPDSVTSIGDRAFYQCDSLTSVTIPNSVTSIEKSAFEKHTSFIVTPGSYAEEYAKDKELSYTYIEESAKKSFIPYEQLCGDWKLIDMTVSCLFGKVTIHLYDDKTGEIECRMSDGRSLTISFVIDYYNEATGNLRSQLSEISGDREMRAVIGLSYRKAGDDAKTLKGKIEDGVLTLTDYYGDYVKCIPAGDNTELATLFPINEQLFGDWQSIPSHEGEPVINMTLWQEGNCGLMIIDSLDQSVNATFQEQQGTLFLTNEATGETNTMTYQLSQDGQSLSLTESGYTIDFVRTVFESNERPLNDWQSISSSDWELRTLEDGTKEVVRFLNKDATEAVIPEGVTRIGNYAFVECYSLANITIPDSVSSIGKHAFRSCSSLTCATIPDGVTEIGEYAFNGCSSLTSVTIPDSVTSIGERAFGHCFALTNITIPGSVISIGDDAFEYSSLENVIIADGVTSIGRGAFSGCSSLTSITIPGSVISIGDYAFSQCSSLASVIISKGVTSIGDYAFWQCASLASVTIPDSVTSMGKQLFGFCSSLDSVVIVAGSYAKQYAEEHGLPYTYPKGKDVMGPIPR